MISTYIGLPGSGKSTLASKIAHKYLKKGYKVFSNFPIKGCYLYDVSDLGTFQIDNCIMILDEAGIDLNNRSYKSMSKSMIQFIKLYRHYHVQHIFVFSQAFDFDITLRRLSDRMYIIKKSLLPWFSYTRRLTSKWDIDEKEGTPKIVWSFLPFSRSYTYRPRFYRYFDSFDCPILPYKEFTLIPALSEGTAGGEKKS